MKHQRKLNYAAIVAYRIPFDVKVKNGSQPLT